MTQISYWDAGGGVLKVRDMTPEEEAQHEVDIAAGAAPVVPKQVAMWQARAILIEDDMLDAVNDALAQISDEKARKLAQAKFEYSSTVQRDDPLVTETIPSLGKTEAEIDAMFIRASEVQ